MQSRYDIKHGQLNIPWHLDWLKLAISALCRNYSDVSKVRPNIEFGYPFGRQVEKLYWFLRDQNKTHNNMSSNIDIQVTDNVRITLTVSVHCYRWSVLSGSILTKIKRDRISIGKNISQNHNH